MPRGSEELTNARKAEIVNACAVLYETRSFKEITLKEIGEKTSFTRTSIYNYFQTKEEIFLALFQREYEAWIEDLAALPEVVRGCFFRRAGPHAGAAGAAAEADGHESL